MSVRLKIALAAVLLALGFASLPAKAERGTGARWCVQETGRGMRDSAPDCRFSTLRQCQETANGIGYCMRNPSYGRRR